MEEKVFSDNSFVKLREEKAGQVSLKLQRNVFKGPDAEEYYGKVERILHSNDYVLYKIAEILSEFTIVKITEVMTFYTNVLL